ncbi:MAG: dihydrolipoyl dehydrogenase [Candidatus Omnitrophota bacterium]|nr:MAG: dihydrolipoyl dehydrogenase [Candidatus Omnitrophota bacterium]
MDYDLTVIGAGWAGINAAKKAKNSQLKVLLIEKQDFGGTCLNRGCIPTKALIQSAKIFSQAKKSTNFGINLENPRPDFAKIQERKNKIIQQLASGMQLMLRGIDTLKAEAQILSPNEIKAADKTIKTKSIVISSGSRPMEIGALKFDNKKIISSDDILSLKEIPKSLLVIGGGVIGCEFACLFSTFGTEVSIVELTPQLLPGMGTEIAKKLGTIFKKKRIKVNTNTNANTLDLNDYELTLLCVGRTASTQGLGLEKAGVALEKNKIIVDEYLRTSVPNIYAAGDSTAKIMLAHYAAYQGEIAGFNAANPTQPQKADNQIVPSCIFTDPEIAAVGLQEEEAKKQNRETEIRKYDFQGSGMARIIDETDGFIKIVSDKKSNVVLGASIIGPRATELIAILSLAVTNRMKASQIRDTIFAHPSVSESVSDCFKENHGI